jgi:hypothetical protein
MTGDRGVLGAGSEYTCARGPAGLHGPGRWWAGRAAWAFGTTRVARTGGRRSEVHGIALHECGALGEARVQWPGAIAVVNRCRGRGGAFAWAWTECVLRLFLVSPGVVY